MAINAVGARSAAGTFGTGIAIFVEAAPDVIHRLLEGLKGLLLELPVAIGKKGQYLPPVLLLRDDDIR